MSTPTVRLAVHQGIARVVLDRPQRLNTIDLPTLETLVEVLQSASDDPAVRCVVLAGEGRTFCAGADQAEMVERDAAEWERIVDRYLDPVRLIADMDKPVIARLQGDVVGGGLGLALACDLRVAADSARFCAPFVRIGLAGCDMSAGWYLPRLVGLGRATELMMTARFVGAPEAERIGLVTRTVPVEQLDDAVDALARSFAEGPATALAYTKRAIRRSVERTRAGEFDYEVHAQVQCLQSADHTEGLAAFRERRRPRFQGAPAPEVSHG